MAKRKSPNTRALKRKTITLRLPPDLWGVIERAAHLAALTPDQVASAILALRLVTLKDGKQ